VLGNVTTYRGVWLGKVSVFLGFDSFKATGLLRIPLKNQKIFLRLKVSTRIRLDNSHAVFDTKAMTL
jgi:hypothetical protein